MRAKIESIEVCRGIAALLVVLFHASADGFQHYFGHEPTNWFRFGRAGVDFFFVLSGFIILYVHAADIGRSERCATFAWRRFVRIYPIYWVVTVAMILAAAVIPALAASPQMRWDALLLSFLLLPQPQVPLLPVAWTLEHEVLFYAVFGLLILHRAVGVTVFALWGAFITVAGILGWSSGIAGFIGSHHNLQFFMGMAAAVAVQRSWVPQPLLFMTVGFCIFGGVAVATNIGAMSGSNSNLLFGIGAAILVAGLAAFERSTTLRVPRFLLLLGAASYSIYLVHLNVLILMSKVVVATGKASLLPAWLLFAGLVVGATAAGIACFLIVERPLLTLLRSRSVPRAPALVAAASGARDGAES